MTSKRIEVGDHLNDRLNPETRIVLLRDVHIMGAPIPFGIHERANVLWEDGAGVWAVVDGHMYGECFPRDAVRVVDETIDERQRRMYKAGWMTSARLWYEHTTQRMINRLVYRALWYWERGVVTWQEVEQEAGCALDYDAFMAWTRRDRERAEA